MESKRSSIEPEKKEKKEEKETGPAPISQQTASAVTDSPKVYVSVSVDPAPEDKSDYESKDDKLEIEEISVDEEQDVSRTPRPTAEYIPLPITRTSHELFTSQLPTTSIISEIFKDSKVKSAFDDFGFPEVKEFYKKMAESKETDIAKLISTALQPASINRSQRNALQNAIKRLPGDPKLLPEKLQAEAAVVSFISNYWNMKCTDKISDATLDALKKISYIPIEANEEKHTEREFKNIKDIDGYLDFLYDHNQKKLSLSDKKTINFHAKNILLYFKTIVPKVDELDKIKEFVIVARRIAVWNEINELGFDTLKNLVETLTLENLAKLTTHFSSKTIKTLITNLANAKNTDDVRRALHLDATALDEQTCKKMRCEAQYLTMIKSIENKNHNFASLLKDPLIKKSIIDTLSDDYSWRLQNPETESRQEIIIDVIEKIELSQKNGAEDIISAIKIIPGLDKPQIIGVIEKQLKGLQHEKINSIYAEAQFNLLANIIKKDATSYNIRNALFAVIQEKEVRNCLIEYIKKNIASTTLVNDVHLKLIQPNTKALAAFLKEIGIQKSRIEELAVKINEGYQLDPRTKIFGNLAEHERITNLNLIENAALRAEYIRIKARPKDRATVDSINQWLRANPDAKLVDIDSAAHGAGINKSILTDDYIIDGSRLTPLGEDLKRKISFAQKAVNFNRKTHFDEIKLEGVGTYPNIDIEKAAQEIFKATYFRLFPERHQNEFQKFSKKSWLDLDGVREEFGALHASRVAAYVKAFHAINLKYDTNPSRKDRFNALASELELNPDQLIKLIQITALFCDSARQARILGRKSPSAEALEKNWNEQSADDCYKFLLKTGADAQTAKLLSDAIRFQTDQDKYKAATKDIVKNNPENCDYVRRLVYDAIRLDKMRIKETFDIDTLHTYQAIPDARNAVVTLAIEAHKLINHHGDFNTPQFRGVCKLREKNADLSFDIEDKKIVEKRSDEAPYKRVMKDISKIGDKFPLLHNASTTGDISQLSFASAAMTFDDCCARAEAIIQNLPDKSLLEKATLHRLEIDKHEFEEANELSVKRGWLEIAWKDISKLYESVKKHLEEFKPLYPTLSRNYNTRTTDHLSAEQRARHKDIMDAYRALQALTDPLKAMEQYIESWKNAQQDKIEIRNAKVLFDIKDRHELLDYDKFQQSIRDALLNENLSQSTKRPEIKISGREAKTVITPRQDAQPVLLHNYSDGIIDDKINYISGSIPTPESTEQKHKLQLAVQVHQPSPSSSHDLEREAFFGKLAKSAKIKTAINWQGFKYDGIVTIDDLKTRMSEDDANAIYKAYINHHVLLGRELYHSFRKLEPNKIIDINGSSQEYALGVILYCEHKKQEISDQSEKEKYKYDDHTGALSSFSYSNLVIASDCLIQDKIKRTNAEHSDILETHMKEGSQRYAMWGKFASAGSSQVQQLDAMKSPKSKRHS